MMKKINILLIFMLFLVSILASFTEAKIYNGINYSNVVFLEDFEYTTSYVSNGWEFTNTGVCANIPTKPFNFASIFTGATLGYGANNITPVCSGSVVNILDNLESYSPIETGFILYELDFVMGQNQTEIATPLTITCGSTVVKNTFQLVLSAINESSNQQGMSITNNRLNGAECSEFNFSKDTIHELKLTVDFDNNAYNFYVDDVAVCNVLALGTENGFCFDGLRLQHKYNNPSNESLYIDNIGIFSTSVAPITVFPVNSFCNNNTECETDNCNLGVCEFKSNRQDCSENSECLSEICSNSKCTKPSLVNNINNVVGQYVGTDDNSLNLFALLIIILVSGAFVGGGFAFGSGTAGGFLGAGSFMMLSLLFSTIGWLSSYIAFGLVFVMLVVMIVMIVLGLKAG